MPSWFTHVPAALGAAAVVAPGQTTRRYWVTAGLCGIIPDLDYVGAPFGNQSIALFFGGHRGFTHSLFFAALLGAAIAWSAFRDTRWDGQRIRLAMAFALAAATHGVLDTLTVQGPPVAFLSPFSSARYELPWQPINPSRVSAGRGFTGLPAVLANEFVWAGLPWIVVGAVALWWRSIHRTRRN